MVSRSIRLSENLDQVTKKSSFRANNTCRNNMMNRGRMLTPLLLSFCHAAFLLLLMTTFLPTSSAAWSSVIQQNPRHLLMPQRTCASRSSCSFVSPSPLSTKSVPRRTTARSSSTTSLNMMFDQLSKAMNSVAKTIGGTNNANNDKMTQQTMQPALRQVRRALLDADVNVDVADSLLQGVSLRLEGQTVNLQGVSPQQQFIKAMYDELVDLMGGSDDEDDANLPEELRMSKPAASLAQGTTSNPAVVLLAGLQGAGKTTTAGKLALYLSEREVDYEEAKAMVRKEQEKQNGENGSEPSEDLSLLPSRLPKRNRSVLLVAADVYRPAAIDQLQVLGERLNITVYTEDVTKVKDPVIIVKNALAYAKKTQLYDTIIVDTAGRQVVDDSLMSELKRMKQNIPSQSPSETLLIVDAMTGQEAATLTAAFDQAVRSGSGNNRGLTGAILTKLDGDSRGGAAVSIKAVSGQPIKYVGMGEGLDDLEPFYPARMASRILGMGDVISLVEKASTKVTEADAQELMTKMQQGLFDFNDFLKQTKLLKDMGSLANVAKFMPGMGGQLSNAQVREAEAKMAKHQSLVNAMTMEERGNPDLFIRDGSARERLIRITKECGLKLQEGQQFITEFQRMKTMMARMQKQMGGDGGGGAAGGMEDPEDMMAMAGAGNRSTRRAAKKKNKGRAAGRGGGGFGK